MRTLIIERRAAIRDYIRQVIVDLGAEDETHETFDLKEARHWVVDHPPELLVVSTTVGTTGEGSEREQCSKQGLRDLVPLLSHPQTQQAFVIILTPNTEPEHRVDCYDAGAHNVLFYPIKPRILEAAIGSLARRQRRLRAAGPGTTDHLVATHIHHREHARHLALRGPATPVSQYAALLAQARGWDPEDAEALRKAVPLRDLGWLWCPRKTWNEAWTQEASVSDWAKQHPQLGHDALAAAGDRMAAMLALTHQEAFDGSGFPAGLVGEEIPEAARITRVAEGYDALTSPLGHKLSHRDAIKRLEADAGRLYDPAIVEVAKRTLDGVSCLPIQARRTG